MVKFETRPPNLNKEGGINQRQLLRTALRMRPDRIIVGECRGAEALDMLQAMNTGVEGSMTTIHANSPRDAFSRLESMILMADLEMPTRVIVQQLASAIKLVVQVSRLQDGSRKVLTIAEVVGVEEDRDQDEGHLRVRAHRRQRRGQGAGAVQVDRLQAEGAGPVPDDGGRVGGLGVGRSGQRQPLIEGRSGRRGS